MLEKEEYKVAIFDCDGVILNSNNIKSKAFYEVVAHDEEVEIEQFLQYHRQNGGVSRYAKFKHYYENIRKLKNSYVFINEAIAKYSDITKRELLTCLEVRGIIEYLDRRQFQCYTNYVVSGGDQAELEYVFSKRNISKYFKTIYGSPETKLDQFSKLIDQLKDVSPIVYFGDSKLDMEIAEKLCINFVYVSHCSDWYEGVKICKERRHGVIRDFYDIL